VQCYNIMTIIHRTVSSYSNHPSYGFLLVDPTPTSLQLNSIQLQLQLQLQLLQLNSSNSNLYKLIQLQLIQTNPLRFPLRSLSDLIYHSNSSPIPLQFLSNSSLITVHIHHPSIVNVTSAPVQIFSTLYSSPV
jgi:hypothetical protein